MHTSADAFDFSGELEGHDSTRLINLSLKFDHSTCILNKLTLLAAWLIIPMGFRVPQCLHAIFSGNSGMVLESLDWNKWCWHHLSISSCQRSPVGRPLADHELTKPWFNSVITFGLRHFQCDLGSGGAQNCGVGVGVRMAFRCKAWTCLAATRRSKRDPWDFFRCTHLCAFCGVFRWADAFPPPTSRSMSTSPCAPPRSEEITSNERDVFDRVQVEARRSMSKVRWF